MLLTSFIVVREKVSKSFFRNAIMPVKNSEILLGVLICVTIVGFLQSLIIFVLSKYVFAVSGLENMVGIMAIILLGCFIFSLMGMVIGSFLRTQESALLTGIFVSIILFVFSGAFIPLEHMSEVVFFLSKFNPFMLLEVFLKRVIIYRLAALTPDLVFIYLFECTLLWIVSISLFSRSKKQL